MALPTKEGKGMKNIILSVVHLATITFLTQACGEVSLTERSHKSGGGKESDDSIKGDLSGDAGDVSSIDDLKLTTDEKNDLIARLRAMNDREATLTADLLAIKGQCSKYVTDLAALRVPLAPLAAQQTALESRIASLSADKATAELRLAEKTKVIDDIKGEIDAIKVLLDNAKNVDQQRSQYVADLAKIQADLDKELQNFADLVNSNASNFDQLADELLEKISDLRSQLAQKRAEINTWEAKLRTDKAKLRNDLSAAQKNLNDQRSKLMPEIIDLRRNVRTAAKALGNAQKELARYKAVAALKVPGLPSLCSVLLYGYAN